MFIADTNGLHAQSKDESRYKLPTDRDGLSELNPASPRFIGPALTGSPKYFALHHPRNSREFAASYRRAFRN